MYLIAPLNDGHEPFTRKSLHPNTLCVYSAPMHRWVNRYRKVGLAVLAVFFVQFVAISFCVIPQVHAAPVTMHGTMDMQYAMDMPMPAGQDMPECTHCTTPDFSILSNQTSDTPTTWALVAVLAILPYQADPASGQEQSLFIVPEASTRSSSLIYQKTLRIRL